MPTLNTLQRLRLKTACAAFGQKLTFGGNILALSADSTKPPTPDELIKQLGPLRDILDSFLALPGLSENQMELLKQMLTSTNELIKHTNDLRNLAALSASGTLEINSDQNHVNTLLGISDEQFNKFHGTPA